MTQDESHSIEGITKAATLGTTTELAERVQDDICPALIRTEVTVIQFERRIVTLTEKVRKLEAALQEQQTEMAHLQHLVRELLRKVETS